MSRQNPKDRDDVKPPGLDTQPARTKPYRKPEFCYERVFETMALACGKVNQTQAACHMVRKNS